ncbi:MAG TPA: SGNH/GDSL hydrolase family protein [Candidatus Aquilonibacter sp.]|nr:SGNH/GDSL hydrolase family protein [Candidatus Aquilonibacter sp.]
MRDRLTFAVLLLVAPAFFCARAQTPSAQTPAATAAPAPANPDPCEAMRKKLDDWPQLGRYAAENAALPAQQPGRVVFYGDSITDAWGRRPDTGEFFPGKPYINRGISGQTTEQMVVRFRQDVIDLHPEAVVILAGTNDIAGNTGPETPETIENDFRSMVDLARANHIRVILASITPADRYPWKPSAGDPSAEIRQINDWLQHFCEENGLTYLDYWDAMAGPNGGMKPGISKDGVHPNTKGYGIMTPLAEAALAK